LNQKLKQKRSVSRPPQTPNPPKPPSPLTPEPTPPQPSHERFSLGFIGDKPPAGGRGAGRLEAAVGGSTSPAWNFSSALADAFSGTLGAL